MVKKPETTKRFYKAANFHPDDHARLQALANYYSKKDERPDRKPVSIPEAVMRAANATIEREGIEL